LKEIHDDMDEEEEEKKEILEVRRAITKDIQHLAYIT
jgi:hypothetical protein